MRLPAGEAHLYQIDPDAMAEEGLAELLTPEDEERRARFVFPRDRHRFLVTRAFTRTVLARYLDVAPQEVRFRVSPFGKPAVDGLHFNLSHTNGLALCLVADSEVGIDVEELRPVADLEQVARRFFAPEEHRELLALPAPEQQDRFFALWTLKEAYVKARGEGLAIPLDSFAFHLDGGGISFSGDCSEEWQFVQWRIGPRHLAAAALPRSQKLIDISHCFGRMRLKT